MKKTINKIVSVLLTIFVLVNCVEESVTRCYAAPVNELIYKNQVIYDGVYEILDLSYTKGITVTPGSKSRINICKNGSSPREKFYLKFVPEKNAYTVRSMYSNGYLGVKKSENSKGKILELYPEEEDCYNEWVINRLGEGFSFELRVESGKLMGISVEITENEVKEGSLCKLTDNQAEKQVVRFNDDKKIDGIYEITSPALFQKSYKVFDTAAVDKEAGLSATLRNGCATQKFYVKYYSETDDYEIMSVYPRMFLGVQKDTEDVARLICRESIESSEDFRWNITKSDDGYMKIQSKSTDLFLEVGETSKEMLLGPAQDCERQKFMFSNVFMVHSELFKITSLIGEKKLITANGFEEWQDGGLQARRDNGQLTIEDCLTIILDARDNCYMIVNPMNGKCLGSSNGRRIEEFDYLDKDEQKWLPLRFKSSNGQFYVFVLKSSIAKDPVYMCLGESPRLCLSNQGFRPEIGKYSFKLYEIPRKTLSFRNKGIFLQSVSTCRNSVKVNANTEKEPESKAEKEPKEVDARELEEKKITSERMSVEDLAENYPQYRDYLVYVAKIMDHKASVPSNIMEIQDPSLGTIAQKLAFMYRLINASPGVKHLEEYPVQILSILKLVDSVLNPKKDKKGSIGEIKTGEGKSYIVMLSALLLQSYGRKIDIVTTNMALVKRDWEEQREYHALFGVTSGFLYSKYDVSFKDPRNEAPGDSSSKQNPSKDYNVEVFDRDIVYSTGSNYCWVCLKDMTRGLTRKREHDVCIVDEADDVLLDDASNPALLAGSFPIRRSEEILEKIFTSVKEKPDFTEADEQNLISELRGAILKKEKEDNLDWENQGSKSEFKPEEVKLMVDAAKEALKLEKGKDYILQETIQENKKVVEVILVDQNTGFILPDTKLHAYIHEMLEIKEGAERSRPSVTICEVSPLTFFNGYTNLIGVTGSAGGEYEESLYEKMYKLETFRVPTNRELRREVMLHLLDEGEDRLAKVEAEIREFAEKRKQPVLVILDSINATNQMHEKFPQAKLIQGIDVKKDAKAILAGGREGTIILSTIAAGRGTDIKLTLESLEAGGLHVIVVNLPARSRTLTQNVGRCSRQGQPGSATVYVGPNDQFKEDYNFSPGTLNRFKLEEMFFAYVKANWPELMQVERKYYSSARYHFGATVEDILAANERVIARRFFWPGKKLTEEECQRYLNMVYQMLLTAWGRMFTDLSMSPDQNDWGKCQKAYNEFIATLEAWIPKDDEGRQLGLGQFIKACAQRTGLGEIIYHQLYEDWHEDETIEDFIYRLLEDPWIRLHMDNAGIDTGTRSITPEKLNFLPEEHRESYRRFVAAYSQAMANYYRNLAAYYERKREIAIATKTNANIDKEIERSKEDTRKAQEQKINEERERSEQRQTQVKQNAMDLVKESTASHFEGPKCFAAERGMSSEDYDRLSESKLKDLEERAQFWEDTGKRFLNASLETNPLSQAAEAIGKATGDNPYVKLSIKLVGVPFSPHSEIEFSAGGLCSIIGGCERNKANKAREIFDEAENECCNIEEESKEHISKIIQDGDEDFRKKAEELNSKRRVVPKALPFPIMPLPSDFKHVDRKLFYNLSPEEVIWQRFGDPSKLFAKYRKQWQSELERAFGRHLTEVELRYIDEQIQELVNNKIIKSQKKYKDAFKNVRLVLGIDKTVTGSVDAALWFVPLGREIKIAKAGMSFIKAMKLGLGGLRSACSLSNLYEGVHDLKAGLFEIDLDEASPNIIKDFVFGGNEHAYRTFETATGLGYVGLEGISSLADWLKGLLKDGKCLKPLEAAASEAIEESAASGSAASTAKNATQASEKLVKVYRGTDIYVENSIYDETGHLMSDATRILYRENGGNIGQAYADSANIHGKWLEKFSSESEFVQAHSSYGGELSRKYNLDRTLMSVTTDIDMAKSFAGAKGRVYEAFVPESSLIRQTLPGSGESEYLIKFGSEEFKWIQE